MDFANSKKLRCFTSCVLFWVLSHWRRGEGGGGGRGDDVVVIDFLTNTIKPKCFLHNSYIHTDRQTDRHIYFTSSMRLFSKMLNKMGLNKQFNKLFVKLTPHRPIPLSLYLRYNLQPIWSLHPLPFLSLRYNVHPTSLPTLLMARL